jgi:DNA-binding HxlR family transcriptional regulator
MPQNLATERLLVELGKGVASVSDLKATIGVSQSSLSRVLTELIRSGRVIQFGVTRGTRYGLRRTVAGIGSSWPLYRLGRLGEIV